jgi:hypothetical protein
MPGGLIFFLVLGLDGLGFVAGVSVNGNGQDPFHDPSDRAAI